MVPRSLGACMACTLVLAGCEPAGPRCIEAPERSAEMREGGHPLGLLRCDIAPELCDRPVASDVSEPDLETAIDLVFLPEGYEVGELPAYVERVDELVRGIRADPMGIVVRDPALFNVHRVDLVANAPAPSLGACRGTAADGSDSLGSDADRVRRAAANAPAADVAIVVVRDVDGRSNADELGPAPAIIHLREGASHRELTHELGHALFHLADEYVDVAEAHSRAGQRRSAELLRPNASLAPDEDWMGLVDGALEGGAQYAYGIYRPTDRCRMGNSESDDGFCPVCSAQIDRFLAARRVPGDGSPFCGFFLSRVDDLGRECDAVDPECEGTARVLAHLVAWDGDGLAELSVSTDATPAIAVPPCLAPECGRQTFFEQEFDFTVDGATRIDARCVDATGAEGNSSLVL